MVFPRHGIACKPAWQLHDLGVTAWCSLEIWSCCISIYTRKSGQRAYMTRIRYWGGRWISCVLYDQPVPLRFTELGKDLPMEAGC